MPGGRPSKFKEEFVAQAQKLCLLGATDEDLADFFSVGIRTIANWKSEHPEFLQALKNGKETADDRVERSLYARAVGYSHDAIHFASYQGEVTQTPYRAHVPPDVTAQIFWLKNRRGETWRDKSEIVHKHSTDQMSDDELERIAAGGSESAPASPVRPPKSH